MITCKNPAFSKAARLSRCHLSLFFLANSVCIVTWIAAWVCTVPFCEFDADLQVGVQHLGKWRQHHHQSSCKNIAINNYWYSELSPPAFCRSWWMNNIVRPLSPLSWCSWALWKSTCLSRQVWLVPCLLWRLSCPLPWRVSLCSHALWAAGQTLPCRSVAALSYTWNSGSPGTAHKSCHPLGSSHWHLACDQTILSMRTSICTIRY